MNGTSFLLLLVFLVAGYVLQPLALPKLQESGYGLTAKKKNVKSKDKTPDATDVPETPKPDTQPRVTDTATDPGNGESAQPMPRPEPRPEPKPEPTPEPRNVELSEGQLLDAMKQSIRSRKISEFSFAQVKEWKFSGKQTINGQTYNVGVASYTAKTLFGDQTHKAKALFKDGKLVKWVWAANNFEMK